MTGLSLEVVEDKLVGIVRIDQIVEFPMFLDFYIFYG